LHSITRTDENTGTSTSISTKKLTITNRDANTHKNTKKDANTKTDANTDTAIWLEKLQADAGHPSLPSGMNQVSSGEQAV